MDFSADHYFVAAVERMNQARFLYESRKGNYALSMYSTGLAVECMLRAYMVARNREFDSRHDLLMLFKESGILNVGTDKLKADGLSDQEIEEHRKAQHSSVNAVYSLWRNNYRYASEARMLSHLKKLKLYRKVKGDILKANAYVLLRHADQFIERGVLQWESTAN